MIEQPTSFVKTIEGDDAAAGSFRPAGDVVLLADSWIDVALLRRGRHRYTLRMRPQSQR